MDPEMQARPAGLTHTGHDPGLALTLVNTARACNSIGK